MFGSIDSSYEDILKFDSYQPGKSQQLKKEKIYTSDTPDDDHDSVLVFKENFAAKPKVQRDRNKTKIRPFRKIVDDLGNKSKDNLGDDQHNTSGFKDKPFRSKPQIFPKKIFLLGGRNSKKYINKIGCLTKGNIGIGSTGDMESITLVTGHAYPSDMNMQNYPNTKRKTYGAEDDRNQTQDCFGEKPQQTIKIREQEPDAQNPTNNNTKKISYQLDRPIFQQKKNHSVNNGPHNLATPTHDEYVNFNNNYTTGLTIEHRQKNISRGNLHSGTEISDTQYQPSDTGTQDPLNHKNPPLNPNPQLSGTGKNVIPGHYRNNSSKSGSSFLSSPRPGPNYCFDQNIKVNDF